MSDILTKALATLAKMRGTSLEHQVAQFNKDLFERRASMRVKPALTEEERVVRTRACKQRALAKARAKRTAARALRSVPTSEEMALKLAARKAAKRASCRRHRVAALRAERAKRNRR